MKQDSNSNTALFLMELIVVICFFSLVAVVCVRLFVGASAASSKSVSLNHAVRTAESLSEAWIVCGGDLNELAALYPGAAVELDGESPENGTFTVWYDGDWKPLERDAADPAEAAYSILLSGRLPFADGFYETDAEGFAAAAKITATDESSGDVICTWDIDHYIGTQGGTP